MAISRYGGITGSNKISEDFEKINDSFNNVAIESDANKAVVDNHLVSTTAHPAENITYSGSVIGANNTKQALDKLKQEINDLVLGGDDADPNTRAEVEIARGGHDTLGDRLNASDAQLAEKANKHWYDITDYGAIRGQDGTEAIKNAISDCVANGGGIVFVPAGTFTISETITIPLGVNLIGDGMFLSELCAISEIDAMIELNSSIKDIYINGNNMANKGVRLVDHYCYLERCKFAYCIYGVYNTKDVHKFMNCAFENCTYGLYSADRFINSFIYGMVAQNNQYGIYVTYSLQQPQALFITHSLFFGNTNRAIYFEKDVFVLSITDCVFDGLQPRAIMLNNLISEIGADITIENCYVDGAEIPIFIGAGYNHVVINNNRIDNGSYKGLIVSGTTDVRSSEVVITNNSFGNNSESDIEVDSVNGCFIKNNYFGLASGYSVQILGSYSGTKPKVIVKENVFPTNIRRVSDYNVIIEDNIGFITNNEDDNIIGVGSTSVTVNHGLSVIPKRITVTPYGNIGHTWVTNINATNFTVNCSIAPSVGTTFAWEAKL